MMITSNFGLQYDLFRAGLAQYSLTGLEYLAQDTTFSRLELQAIADEAQARLTAQANA